MVLATINDRYEINKRLGSGGMGEVWLAYDRLLGRNVAIKFVGERELRATPGAKAILRDEARAAGSLLGYPQIVAVLDLLDVSTALHEGPALVMEYVEGCNVAEWIEVWRPKLDAVTQMLLGLYIALEATQAIQAAHLRNIMHRDVKPLNILLSAEGRVKVADFGLARVVEAITRTHTVWGRQTPLYAAPEQWQGEKPTKATDVYQLCATIYHLLAGQPVNEGGSILDLLRWHETETPKPLVEHVPTLEPHVASIIDRGLTKKGEARPGLWEIFDGISGALFKGLKLEVNVKGCSTQQISLIADITDFDLDTLKKQKVSQIDVPNPLEAAQEGIAVVLAGGISTLHQTQESVDI